MKVTSLVAGAFTSQNGCSVELVVLGSADAKHLGFEVYVFTDHGCHMVYLDEEGEQTASDFDHKELSADEEVAMAAWQEFIDGRSEEAVRMDIQISKVVAMYKAE